MKTLLIVPVVAVLTLATMAPGTQTAQTQQTQRQDHPKKNIFQDVANWATTAPGDVKLKNFGAFRAVYDRNYRQGSGVNTGDLRQDRIIISAEDVGWDGQSAVAITIIDSGIVEHADTNARVTTMFVGLDDLNSLMEIGPIPGTAKDYYISRVMENSIRLSRIRTDTQGFEREEMETSTPGFGLSAWVMASMELSEGLKINLAPYYSARGNPLTSASYGHIIGQRPFVDGSGEKHQAWVLETSRNLSSPRVSHVYLIDRPPYYLGTETVDLETGERKPFVWLRRVELFDQ